MLASFSLANFKSYASATLPLAPLTVLVGANAAGKSNLQPDRGDAVARVARERAPAR